MKTHTSELLLFFLYMVYCTCITHAFFPNTPYMFSSHTDIGHTSSKTF